MTKHLFQIVFQSLEIKQPIKFDGIAERFNNIELIPISGKKHNLILYNEDTAENANSIVTEFIDRISLLDSHQVSSFQYIGKSVDNQMTANSSGTSYVTADLTTKIQDPLTFYNLDANKKAFKNTLNLGAVKVYRDSQNIKDDISRYLIYYGILQILISDSQKAIDDYIKQKVPLIETQKRMKIFNGKEVEIEETIITKTRNLIAHPKNNIYLNSIKGDVSQNIETLQQLVLNKLKDL
jgi:hypothetical protein